MERVDLSYGKLERAVLDHADLAGGDLQYADLRGAHLFGARLDAAKLKQARLDGANLSCAWVRNADLEAADLPMAVLLKTRLDGAKLRDAGLEGAYLAQARLAQAELARSYLAGADLRAAVLEDAQLGVWPSGLPFFGWANLQGIEGQPAYGPEVLKEGQAAVWRRIAPQALPTAGPANQSGAIHAFDEVAYEDRLAALLTGKVCDPEADAHELQGLATRVLWDKDVIKEVTAFHKKVALGLLRAAAEVVPDGGPEDAMRTPPCPQAAEMPQGMRDGLRSLLTTPLGATLAVLAVGGPGQRQISTDGGSISAAKTMPPQ
jgi:Pentapeptide repeats (8 copies)